MKKINVLLIIISMLVGIFIGHNATNIKTNNVISTTNETKYYNSQVEFYDNIISDIDTVKVYNTNELTTKILANRNGKIIIEKVIGEVQTDELDGEILNCIDKNHNYISYKNADGVKKGNVVLTYFIYNPLTNDTDDVLTRVDFIIDGKSI